MEDIEAKAMKEADRIDNILANLEVIDNKAGSLVQVLDSYHKDCKGFIEKKQFLEALETAFICWAYVDAGLHLGVFKVPEKIKNIFTVDG